MTSPASPPGGGEFFLDTELARAAVDQLRKVHGQLGDLMSRAVDLARQPRTAHDPVSTEAFDLLAMKAVGGAGSFADAVKGAMIDVDALIAQMETDIARQEQVDEDAARGIARS